MPSKNYNQSAARAAECFRLAVSLMTQQPTRPHPQSYSVWYEHVSGVNQALSTEIERLMAAVAQLDEDQTLRLYQKYVLNRDAHNAMRLTDGVRELVVDVGESARQAGQQSASFEAALGRWQQAVEAGQGADPERCAAIQSDTEVMRAAVAELQQRMERTIGEVDRLQAELVRVQDEAMRDSLTGLANRRAFDLRLADCFGATDRAGCLLVADIDHFKKVNDTYGHLFGDQVLRAVAEAIRSCLAPQQMAARTGGEEFAILLPGASLTQGQVLAEKIRVTVAGSRIRRRGDGESIGHITISLGASPLRGVDTPDAWYERADQALYAAKKAGRNRVSVAA